MGWRRRTTSPVRRGLSGADAVHDHDAGPRRPRRRRGAVPRAGHALCRAGMNQACQADDARSRASDGHRAALVRPARGMIGEFARSTRARRGPGPAGARHHVRVRGSGCAWATSRSSSTRRPAARPSTAAWCGCRSTAIALSATCLARCSRTSRTSTRCAATSTGSLSRISRTRAAARAPAAPADHGAPSADRGCRADRRLPRAAARAVEYVHGETVARINAGQDIHR